MATALTLSYPKWYVIAPSYLLAVSVAYSRINLGVHYFSDVLGGAALGTGCAYLAHLSTIFIQKRYGKSNSTALGITPAGCITVVLPF